MPFYFQPTPLPLPSPPKTSNYSFTKADSGVPVQFNTTNGSITATLPDPTSVAGCTFMANKMDGSVNFVMITAPSGFNFTLSDIGASVVIMAANGSYIVMADFTP